MRRFDKGANDCVMLELSNPTPKKNVQMQ